MPETAKTGRTTLQQILLKLLAFVLWAVTIALGFIEILIIHHILTSLLLSAYGGDEKAIFKARYTIDAFGRFSFVILGIGWLIFFLVTTHYHYKYAAARRSWKLFAWTIGVEGMILVIGYW